MNYKRYPLADYPGDLWHDWDALNLQYCQSHPMLDSRFVRPLTTYFPAKIDVLAGFQGQELVALFLLDGGKGLIQLPYLPGQAQLALALVPNNISSVDLFRLAALHMSALRLDLLAIDSQYQRGLLEVDGVETEPRYTDMVIDVLDEFSDYWSQRPKKLRKNMTRRRKK